MSDNATAMIRMNDRGRRQIWKQKNLFEKKIKNLEKILEKNKDLIDKNSALKEKVLKAEKESESKSCEMCFEQWIMNTMGKYHAIQNHYSFCKVTKKEEAFQEELLTFYKDYAEFCSDLKYDLFIDSVNEELKIEKETWLEFSLKLAVKVLYFAIAFKLGVIFCQYYS